MVAPIDMTPDAPTKTMYWLITLGIMDYISNTLNDWACRKYILCSSQKFKIDKEVQYVLTSHTSAVKDIVTNCLIY